MIKCPQNISITEERADLSSVDVASKIFGYQRLPPFPPLNIDFRDQQNPYLLGTARTGDRVQSFMQEHTDEITALAVSPCSKWVATGETGANPKARHYLIELATVTSNAILTLVGCLHDRISSNRGRSFTLTNHHELPSLL